MQPLQPTPSMEVHAIPVPASSSSPVFPPFPPYPMSYHTPHATYTTQQAVRPPPCVATV
jgi:hypothetical protein